MKKGLFVIMFIALTGGTQGSIIDQSQELDGIWLVISPEWSMAQTFTAGITGQLEKVDLCLDNNLPPETTSGLYPITVSVVSVIDEVPSGPVLGTVYEAELSEGFNSFDFLSESVFLDAGLQYGIVLFNDDPDHYEGISTQWCANGDVYAGGAAWVYTLGEWTQSVTPPGGSPVETFYDIDAAFRTHVVGEPAGLLLLGLGLGFIRKRR